MALSTYKKRSGTSDRGKDYEWLLCAYYSLKLATSTEVSDFHLFTNIDFFGDFDDIVARVKFVDGSVEVFLLQLKHSENNKSVTLAALTSPTGNFTISKYKKSYDDSVSLGNFRYILYTNRGAKFKDGTKIRVETENVTIKQHGCVGRGFLDTTKTKTKMCSVFKFEGPGFFQRFYLYVGQQNDTNLKQSISDILKKELHSDIYTTFVEFMRSWWCGNFKLTKEDVIAKLAELVLAPLVKTLTWEKTNYRTELIKGAIMSSDISLVSSDSGVATIWTRMSEDSDVKRVSLTGLKFGLITKGVSRIDDLSPEKRSKVLWFMDEVPLIIDADTKKDQFSAIISLLGRCTKKKKLVIVGETDVNLHTWKTFRHLADVHPELRQEISTNFTCMLQGKRPVSLQDLGIIGHSFEVAQLLEIAIGDSFNVGESSETLPPVYIPRSLYKILLDYKAIDDLKKSQIFLSCNNQKIPPRKIRKRKVPFSSSSKMSGFFKHHIYTTKAQFKKDLVEKESSESEVHHFRVIDGQNLQWLTSNCSTEALLSYRRTDSNHIVSESEIDDHFHNKIRLLTSHTGTGKTCFLNRIKNEAPCDHLVVKMNLKEHSHFFKSYRYFEDTWDYIVQFTKNVKDYNTFETEIMQKFDKDKVLLLWDGFDDLHETSRSFFIRAVVSLRNSGLSQWVTAQNRSQKFLEDAFGVFSMSLVPFSQDEQICYIQKRCGVIDDAVLKNFYENMKIIDNQEYLGVPLQLYILTDIFCKNPKLLEDVYTLTDIFAAYIEGKYKHFLVTEGTSTEIRSFGSLIEDAKTYRLSQYKIAALRTCIPKLAVKLGLQNDKKFMDDVKGGDFLDLIVKVEGLEGFVFEHQILGEYLSASYLAEHLPPSSRKYIFQDKCRNIRFMFDLLLADNNPTFIAILYKKLSNIGTNSTKDKAGRSPLHLICSYGRKHPTEINTIAEDEDMKATVKTLSKIFDPFEKDDLFQWTSYDYADHSHSLGLIEALGTDLSSVISSLHCYDLGTILYYSIKMNYSHLFMSVEEVPYFEDPHGHNLLHLAIESNREKYLQRLLSQKTYTKLINRPNHDNWTPLHLATFHCDLSLVKNLITKGATIKLHEPSLMSLAVARSNKDMVEFFLRCGCNPNEFYHTNYFTTSIFQAIDQKLDDIVDLLVRHGAQLLCVNRNGLVREKQNPFGMNLFHLLLENEQFAEAEAVLKRGIHVDSVDYEGRTAFHHAASNNQNSVVKFLLSKGGNCHVLDYTGQNPLHSAAKAGSLEVGGTLIDESCDFNLQDEDGMSPLHCAVMWGQSPFVSMLVEKGSDPNMGNKHGRTPMHMAARHDLIDCIKTLWENGANFETRDGLYGRTALHLAAWYGHDDCIRTLLDLGADVHSTCNFGFTPLHLAVEESWLDSCRLLMDAGASISVVNRNGMTPLSLVDKKDLAMCRFFLEYDKLPVHSAVLRYHCDFISELVSMGLDINARDDNGDTPLHFSVRYAKKRETEHLEEKLIEMGAICTAQNHYGYTPLHCALQMPTTNKERINKLLNKDVVNITTTTGLTPLHLAAQLKSQEAENIVQILIDAGAKTDAVDRDGFTPLYYAASVGNLDIVTILSGQDPDKLTKPLHVAATGGHVSVVEYLLGRNASVGITCFEDTLRHEHPNVLKILLDHGDFDVCATNHKGRNLLHMCAKQGFLDLVKYFTSLIPLNVTDIDGTTPIEEALYNRHFDIFNFLLQETTFDVNKYSVRYKRYPLHVVACTGKLNLVELFVNRGAKIDVVDEDANTPLHNSVNYDCKDVFKFLLKGGGVNARNARGETPLHVAAAACNKEIIDDLIEAGADMDLVDNEGNTALDLLFQKGLLLETVIQKTKKIDLEKRRTFNGQTILYMALEQDVKLVEWLIQKGASVNTRHNEGSTPLHVAAGEDTNILTLMMDKCEDLNVTNDQGDTILHIAASHSLPNVEEILKRGASPSIANKFGQIPLHYALRRPKIFKYLWNKTPNVDVFTISGHTTRTVLHEAVTSDGLEVTKFFLEVGFKGSDPDENGRTPLWEAARSDQLKTLELLLEKDKKSVDFCNARGETLLHFAASEGNFSLVKLLVKYGARRDLRNDDGCTAADLAKEHGHKKVSDFLTSGKITTCYPS